MSNPATHPSIYKSYYLLTKPGIIRGNAITAAAGFLLASRGHINYALFLITIVGLSLVVAAACVFNNFMDRDIDAKMARTKQRALVQGLIPGHHALIYGTVLLALGLLALISRTNLLATLLALFGFLAYVVLYGYWKRRSPLGTVVGSISGAIPPVVGYCAVTNRFDLGAALLFLILILWQMPHFYTIAMYRLEDYRAAGIPVLPLKKGFRATKVQILTYILVFIPVTLALTAFGYTGYTYLAVATALGLAWLGLGLTGLRTTSDQADKRWARKMFFVSLIVITVLSVMMSID